MRRREAEPLFRRALAIFGTSLGPDHPSTATARRNLMGLEAERGKGREGAAAPAPSWGGNWAESQRAKLDGNDKLTQFSGTLERVSVETVETG